MGASPRDKTGKRLGELLLEQGRISPQQLESALAAQRESGEFLGTLLVRKGWLTEDALLQTLAQQAGIPYVHLDAGVDWSVASRFSLPALVAHQCLPIRIDDQSVTVAVANPLEAWALDELQRLVGDRKISVVLAPHREIAAAIRQAQRYAVESLNTPQPPDHGHPE